MKMMMMSSSSSSFCIWKISFFILIVLPTPTATDATQTFSTSTSSSTAFQHYHYRFDTTRIRQREDFKGWTTATFPTRDGSSSSCKDVAVNTSQHARPIIYHHHQTTRRRIHSSTSLFLSRNENENENLDDDDDGRGGQGANGDKKSFRKLSSDDVVNNDNKSNNKSQPSNKQQNNKESQQQQQQQQPNILQMINPFNAGKSLRSTVESAIDLASAIASTKESSVMASRLPPDRRAIYYNYYVDDQLGLSSLELKDDALSTSSTTSTSLDASKTSKSTFNKVPTTTSNWLQQNPNNNNNNNNDYRPEVLIIGATGKLGRILVKRLILENNVRVRVLVRDLYSSTLNKLGVGVTYCQGDLGNMESLEYAVTDVDKIIFCAGGCSGDDESGVVNDGGKTNKKKNHHGRRNGKEEEEEGWDQLESILDQRNKQAELVDGIGLRNLLHAYMNVRHSDYGPSQAAKRTLFKFRKRPADFGLFGIDDGSIDEGVDEDDDDWTGSRGSGGSEAVATSLAQCEWTKNKFGHGVFTGKVDRYGEAALASARLRSRNDPELGIDLSVGGFAGLVCRICSDGGVYEAFVRTEAFERLGVEYVCEFKTASKSPPSGGENRSRDKFSTVRLEFKDFLPRIRPQFQTKEDEEDSREALGKSGNIPKFVGKDIRQLGFRFRGQSNPLSWSSGFSRFYLALDFIKVYRGQPEPEFVYLSDSRIPPVVNDGMVKHDIKRLITNPIESSQHDVISLIDEKEAQKIRDREDRSAEETYYKYMGEEMIKQSGLSYTIIRVAGYNEKQAGTDSSTVRLQKMNKDIFPVSRADLAQVVASAILEPNACNLVLYMTKSQTRGVKDGYLWEKFARLKEKSKSA